MTAAPTLVEPTLHALPAGSPASPVLHPLEQIRRQVAASLFDEAHEPSTIGRFQVLRVVGAGGMGVVYAARDPQLDRTVALKLLHPAQLGPAAQQRLLREAQAMARLQHPNVLAVYDAGVHAGQVWVAMEYEGGGTLADWLRAAPRRWPEIVELLAQAGRGLAAAHAAGLVHRDFKPANILVGGGRIRITDFGLARLGEEAAADFERTVDEHAAALAEPMTRTGAVLGTPAYMAPEQLAGRQASARSDQFAFCVVLYEALHGHRPYRGDDLAQLREAFTRGAMVRPLSSLPRALQAVLTRGLAIDPARRFPAMDALLAALGRVRATPRRVWAAAAAGAGMAGLLYMSNGTYDGAAASAPTEAVASDGARDRLAEVWSPERAAALRDALPDVPVEVDALVAALDGYAARWREVRAAQPTGGWTDTCLDDRLRALDDLVTVVAEGIRESARLVADGAEFLPDVADCAAPSLYNTLTSQGLGPMRRAAWRGRLLLAGGLAPRALKAARAPEMGQGIEAFAKARVLHDPRLDLELELAAALTLHHAPSEEPNTFRYVDPRTGERVVHEEHAAPRRESTLRGLRDVAERSAAEGFADVAARAWAGVAELLEAGPHDDGARVAAWDGLRAALAKLPAEHRLRRRLAVDLAVFEAAHARHASAPGSCRGGDKFGACEAVYRAIDDLAAALRDETDASTRRWLAEQLAQAHEHAGDPEVAAAVRAANPGEPDRRDPTALGYLDFAAGEVTPPRPGLDEAIRCTYDHSRCEIDPAYLAGEDDPEALLAGGWFFPLQKDGELAGFKVMGTRGSDVMRHVDLVHRDEIVAVDGVPVGAPEFVWDPEAVRARGRLSLTVVRGDATLAREFVLRAP